MMQNKDFTSAWMEAVKTNVDLCFGALFRRTHVPVPIAAFKSL